MLYCSDDMPSVSRRQNGLSLRYCCYIVAVQLDLQAIVTYYSHLAPTGIMTVMAVDGNQQRLTTI